MAQMAEHSPCKMFQFQSLVSDPSFKNAIQQRNTLKNWNFDSLLFVKLFTICLLSLPLLVLNEFDHLHICGSVPIPSHKYYIPPQEKMTKNLIIKKKKSIDLVI